MTDGAVRRAHRRGARPSRTHRASGREPRRCRTPARRGGGTTMPAPRPVRAAPCRQARARPIWMNLASSPSSSQNRPRCSLSPLRARGIQERHERGRDEEAGRVDQRAAVAPAVATEITPTRNAELGTLLNGSSIRDSFIGTRSHELHGVREQRRARRPWRIERRAGRRAPSAARARSRRSRGEAESQQPPRAREIGDDGHAESEPVDDAAEERRDHRRQEVEEDGEARERRAPRRRQDVPEDAAADRVAASESTSAA